MKLLDSNLIHTNGDQWALLGQNCPDCGKIAFPRKRVCPDCFGDQVMPLPLSKHGRLHTFATTRLGAPGMPVPYSFGFLDLPEGVKLLGMIRGVAEDMLRIGMAMEIVLDTLRKDEDGEDIACYIFRPASGKMAA